MKDIRLSKAINRFLSWATTNNRPMTVYVYRHYLNRFLSAVGDVWLSSLTPAMLTGWSKKYHPVQAVQRLASWSKNCDRSIDENPLQGMPKVKVGMRRRVFSRREVTRIVRRADRRFRLVAIALRESIARPQEVRSLAWDHLYRRGGEKWNAAELLAGNCFFVIDDAKGFDRRADPDALRVIPVSPRLGRLLWRLWIRGADPKLPIFLNRAKRPWTGNAVRCQMRKLRALVGIVRDRRGENVVAYTFRHTGATQAVLKGIRGRMLSEWMGHSSERTTHRYVHLNPADLIDAAKTVWEAKPLRRGERDEEPEKGRSHSSE